MGTYVSEDGRVKRRSPSENEYILDDRWSFEVPDVLVPEFDKQYLDVANIPCDASLVLKGLNRGENYLCVIAVEPILMFLQTDPGIDDCRHDNDVASGNAQQEIITDTDDFYVDIISMNVLFTKTLTRIRLRTKEEGGWDFSLVTSSEDDMTKTNWDTMYGWLRSIAMSLKKVHDNTSSDDTYENIDDNLIAELDEDGLVFELDDKKTMKNERSREGEKKKETKVADNIEAGLFSKKSQTGIHHVKKSFERVIVGDAWSIEVPKGYSYSADKAYTGPDEDGMPYMLHIQTTKDCDLEKSFFSEIELMVKSQAFTFNYYTLDATHEAEIMSDVLMDIADVSPEDVKTIKKNKNIVVVMASTYEHMFLVCVAGINLIYRGAITFHPDSMANEEQVVKQFVNSIEPVKITDIANADALCRLDSSYLGDLSNIKYVQVDNNFKVPVPDGFKSSTSVHESMQFVVAGEGFNFRQDPTTARFSLGIRKIADTRYQKENAYSTVMETTEMINQMMPAPIFDSMLMTVRFDEKGLIVFGTCTNSACTKNTNPFLILTGNKLYYGIVTINYGRAISDDIDTVWDQRVITTAWLSRILFKGERVSHADEKGNTVTVTRKAARKNNRKPSKMETWGFKEFEVPDRRKKLIDNQNGFPIRILPHSEVMNEWEHDEVMFQYYCMLHRPNISKQVSLLLQNAEKYSRFFKEREEANNLQQGKLKNSAPIHALRSFIWTAVEIQGNKTKSTFPADAPEEMWLDLAEFIGSHRYANYEAVDKKAKRFGTVFLRKEEVRSVYTDACGYESYIFSNSRWRYKNESLSKTMNSASTSSFFELIDSLEEIMPVMELYYNKLKSHAGQIQNDVAEHIKMILEGWCVYAFACRQPFFIVPGNHVKNEFDIEKIQNWTIGPAMEETQNGSFSLCNSEIVKINFESEEINIPEGVTGIIVNEDTKPELTRNLANTRKITYPHSYTGPIIVPKNVHKIEVLGDPEIFRTVSLSEESNQTLSLLTITGKPKAIGEFAFRGLDKLKYLRIPEGVEKLYDQAFCGFTPSDIFLPSTLKDIGEFVFAPYKIDPNVSINVYSDCPVLGEIKRQLKEYRDYYNDHSYLKGEYRIELKELGVSSEVWAAAFVKSLCGLYNEKVPTTEAKIRKLLNNTIGDVCNFGECRNAIEAEAERNELHNVKKLIQDNDDDKELYLKLPGELEKDINCVVENRIREEKRARYKRIKELSASDKIDDLNDAIALLRESAEIKNVDVLIERCSDKISNIKKREYVVARSLASAGDEESLISAIEKLEQIDPFEDSSVTITKLRNQLESERKYNEAIKLSNSDSPERVYEAMKTLDGLSNYKDAIGYADSCREKIRVFARGYQEKAENLLNNDNEKSLKEAASTYKEMLSWDYDEQEKKIYQQKEDSIQELRALKSSLDELWGKYAQIGGAFRKKERKAVEEEIQSVERRIIEVKKELGYKDIGEAESVSDVSRNQSPPRRNWVKWVLIAIIVILIGVIALMLPSFLSNTDVENEGDDDSSQIQTEATAENGYKELTSGELQGSIWNRFSEQWPDIEVVDETYSHFDDGYGELCYQVGDTAVIIRTQSEGEEYDYTSPIDYCVVSVSKGTYGYDCIALISNELFGSSVSKVKEDIKELLAQSKEETGDSNLEFRGYEYQDPLFQLSVAFQDDIDIAMILPADMDGNKVLVWSGIQN